MRLSARDSVNPRIFFLISAFVGQGMLSAAVSGAVFTSPPAGNILAAIRASHSPDNGTLLYFINNLNQ